MAKVVAKTYGDALFELALEEDRLEELSQELNELMEIFRENPELAKLMTHPKIEKGEKCQVMEEILRGRVSDSLAGFLDVIIRKDRYGDLPAIHDYFIRRVKEYRNVGTAYVTSALPLREEQKEQVEKRLLELTGHDVMDMNFSVDSALIGGMVIRIGDRVVDGSVRTKLNRLSRELSKIQISASGEE